MTPTQHFQALGFTQLESDIYLYLLRHGLSTGYSIAKGIQKPAANVYKALDTLAVKGGIVSAQGSNKAFNAIHWQELLDNHKKQFDTHIDTLSEQLKSVARQDVDEQVYQIDNCDQVIETTLRMLDGADSVILGDVEPEAIPIFDDALQAAAARGVEVRVKTYQPIKIAGVHTTLRRHGPDIHQKSADVAFSLCCDGHQFVTAMLSKDKKSVIQAFQSHSALMNLTIHTNILYGQVLTDLKDFLKNDDLKSAKAVLADTEHLHPLSSENVVFQRYKNRYGI